jgi:fluoride ion exporter CrcB/FEX
MTKIFFIVGVRNSLPDGGLFLFSPQFVGEKLTTFLFHEDFILSLSGSFLISSILSLCKKIILFSFEVHKSLNTGFCDWFIMSSTFILNNNYGMLRRYVCVFPMLQ